MDEFKRFFLRGLAAVLPTLLTIAIIIWAYNLVDKYLGQHISRGLIKIIAYTGQPEAVDEEDALTYGQPLNEWLDMSAGDLAGRRVTIEYKVITSKALASRNDKVKSRAEQAANDAYWQIAFAKYKLHLIGFVIAIIVVYFVGFFLASFFGRATWRFVEKTVSRVPLIRAIYPNIKQVTDFLFGEQKVEFSAVVAVQYPRKGIWSLGLLTGSPIEGLERHAGEELLTVFVPSSPTPATGYTITVPRREVVELAISIDQALRFMISAGVIKPHMELDGGLSDED